MDTILVRGHHAHGRCPRQVPMNLYLCFSYPKIRWGFVGMFFLLDILLDNWNNHQVSNMKYNGLWIKLISIIVRLLLIINWSKLENKTNVDLYHSLRVKIHTNYMLFGWIKKPKKNFHIWILIDFKVNFKVIKKLFKSDKVISVIHTLCKMSYPSICLWLYLLFSWCQPSVPLTPPSSLQNTQSHKCYQL